MSEMSVEHLATNFYYDRTFDCDAAKILPGEYYFSGKDMVIVTVLGSCVSACIRDRVSGIGGMNHFMLPDGGGDENSPVSASMRYGNYAMEILINELLKAGARRENFEAKVFGGGNVLRGFTAINVGFSSLTTGADFTSSTVVSFFLRPTFSFDGVGWTTTGAIACFLISRNFLL